MTSSSSPGLSNFLTTARLSDKFLLIDFLAKHCRFPSLFAKGMRNDHRVERHRHLG